MFIQRFNIQMRYGLALITLLLAACNPVSITPTSAPAPGPDPESGPATPLPEGDLIIYSGRSEALVVPVIEAFKAHHPEIEVVLKAGTNSALANALLEEQANPQADLFLTTELVTVQKMANEGVFQPYQPHDADSLPAEYHHPEWLWSGLTLRARVIMYNTDLVSADEAPQSIFDLTAPQWKGQVAAAGSANGGMQAQVAAMRQLLGDEKSEAWLTGLLANEVTFFGGHTDVRKAVGAGEFKLGLVNHYYYYLQKAEGSPVAVVYPDQGDGQLGLLVNATAIGVVKGARHAEAAGAFIDFLLSEEGQKLFAELNYEYPVRPGVALHPEVTPLNQYRLARYDFVTAANDLDTALDMLERVGIP
jgi:iron(III) transport system substrate-binding protein